MCTYSMVIDQAIKNIPSWPTQPNSTFWPNESQRIRELESRVRELEDLIKAAKEYDIKNNEPDCELEAKKIILKKLSEELGIKINFE